MSTELSGWGKILTGPDLQESTEDVPEMTHRTEPAPELKPRPREGRSL